MSDPITIDANQETFSIPDNPTPSDVNKLMDRLSRFMTDAAVSLLTIKGDDNPPYPVVHPAVNALMQSAQVLQNGCAQMEMMARQERQQRQLAMPGGPQRVPGRMN